MRSFYSGIGKKKTTHSLMAVAVLVLVCSFSTVAQDDYQSSGSIQLLYGEDFDPADNNLMTLTSEHFLTVNWFEYFGFVDLYYDTGSNRFSSYLEWYPKAKLVSIGSDFMEILAGTGINASFVEGENMLVGLAGPVWRFSLPGFRSFQVETYYYKQISPQNYDGTYQITPSWDIVLPVSHSWRFRLPGFVDFIGEVGQGEPQIIAQPQLLLDIGNFWEVPGHVYIGTEWRYWQNKFGVEDLTESVFQWQLRVDI